MNEQGSIGSVVRIDADNVAEIARDFPRKVSLALKALTKLRYGSVQVTMPGGRTFAYDAPEDGPHGQAVLHNWGIVRRAVTHGSLGVAESYLDGEWDSPDVTGFLHFFLLNSYDEGGAQFFARSRLVNFFNGVLHWFNRNTKAQAQKNIAAHYDLGNAFYEQWLDRTMTYSSALYSTGANDLEQAQTAKYRKLAEATGVQSGHHVLEIGCGWGGNAEFLAGTVGADVTCLTISREQLDYAQARMQRAGLGDKVDIKFQDYRDETGIYDRIISIEMFEAVGESYWPSYFSQLHDRLKPGGRAGVQVITIKDQDYAHYRDNPDFIQKYIFPGGMLPSDGVMKTLGEKVGLSELSDFGFGKDYAETLAVWHERFSAAWPTIEPLGFDDRFKRMWSLYLSYCEAGFLTGSIDVRQIVYGKPA